MSLFLTKYDFEYTKTRKYLSNCEEIKAVVLTGDIDENGVYKSLSDIWSREASSPYQHCPSPEGKKFSVSFIKGEGFKVQFYYVTDFVRKIG